MSFLKIIVLRQILQNNHVLSTYTSFFQIRMNLWNRKVYDILFRLLACKCGHGYLKHEEEITLPPPKPVQLKKTAAKTQLKPELKDAKLKKAKKLSSKSAMSESFKRHQEAKKETGGADENGVSFEVEVINSVAYIPGLATTTVKSKKKSRKSSLENDSSITSPVILNPSVRPFIPRCNFSYRLQRRTSPQYNRLCFCIFFIYNNQEQQRGV